MNKDLLSNLVCQSNVGPLRTEKIDGVSWIIPANTYSEERTKVDLLSLSQNILLDFFKLGEILEAQLSSEEYRPLYLIDDILDLAKAKGPGKAAFQLLLPAFKDENSVFLRNNSDIVVEGIRDFFDKYGLPRSSELNMDSMPGNFIHYIAEHVFQRDHYFKYICYPVSFLAYYIFELYYRFTAPQRYEKLMKEHLPKHIYLPNEVSPKPQLGILINVRLTYTAVSGWVEQKFLQSIFDFIALLLFYSEEIKVRKCRYCGAIFITSLDNAIYCSPSCRNRSNSKKSYERRKAKNLSKGDGEA